MRYDDAPAAIAWLEKVLGFTRHAVYEEPDNTIAHAELRFGNGMIMLGSSTNPSPMQRWLTTPAKIDGRVTSPIYLITNEIDALYARAQAANAEITGELRTMDYGGKAFSVRDPEGYFWSLGEYDPWNTGK
jgi:uncharacterized glyoxalase superfamily protein PhnB